MLPLLKKTPRTGRPAVAGVTPSQLVCRLSIGLTRLGRAVFAAGLLAGGLQASFGFSLGGPINEAYQVPTIGYNLPGDINAPKNLGQEYRRNTPVIYYTCDANFWDYFGARGVAEIDKAFNAFNAIPPVSKMSADLSEFPLAARRTNYKAEALGMFDLKSTTMALIIEQLGLAEPDRYIWTIHDRWLQPNTSCPLGEVYLMIKRNFDPLIGTSLDQLKPTSYLNGVLYSYEIIELCNSPIPPIAWGQAVAVDAEADSFTAIASGFGYNSFFTFNPYGAFFTGLTRDDVGGLRYLLRTNNMNIESAGPNTVTLLTNPVPQLIVSSNLSLLASQSLTNDAGPLSALYPNLQIVATSNYFVNVTVTNVTPYFTNYPWDPVGTPAHLVEVTNLTQAVQTRYGHTFANLLQLIPTDAGWTVHPIARIPDPNGYSWITIETTSVAVSNNPWAPFGSTQVLTNTSLLSYQTNDVVGDFILVPTNMCDIAIVTSQLTNVVTTTNVLFVLTNISISTNVGGTTNAGTVLSYTQNLITYTTNHTFVIYPIICDPTNVALRQGIEKINFVRRDYDSLLSRFFIPITNEYVLNAITNGAIISQRVRRTVTFPDILLTAQDLSPGPDARPSFELTRRGINFNANNAYVGLAGPGTIEPTTTFTYNNVGPIYENFGMINTNAYLQELDQIPLFIWGSFDGSTNVPVVYPNDASIVEMENQVLIQVAPPYLPTGVLNVDYFAQLQVQSSTEVWQAPFYWFLAPNSLPMPPGLQIMTGGDGSGLIYGIPQQIGMYDFVIRVMDSQGHTVDRSYAIRIDPPQ